MKNVPKNPKIFAGFEFFLFRTDRIGEAENFMLS